MVSFRDLLPARRAESRLGKSLEDSLFADLQRNLSRVIEDFFEGGALPAFGEQSVFGKAVPRVDVAETDQEIRVTAELPGMSEKEVEVTLDEDTLTIRGEKKKEEEHKEGNVYRSERMFGQFMRTIPLPAPVDEGRVEAVFKQGVLHITLPKTGESPTRKKIEVKTGE